MVNASTYGSELHMPFGGVKQSGNGSRKPGTEARDVYSNHKNVIIAFDPISVYAIKFDTEYRIVGR